MFWKPSVSRLEQSASSGFLLHAFLRVDVRRADTRKVFVERRNKAFRGLKRNRVESQDANADVKAGSSKDFAIDEIDFDRESEWVEDRERSVSVANGAQYLPGLSTATTVF